MDAPSFFSSSDRRAIERNRARERVAGGPHQLLRLDLIKIKPNTDLHHHLFARPTVTLEIMRLRSSSTTSRTARMPRYIIAASTRGGNSILTSSLI